MRPAVGAAMCRYLWSTTLKGKREIWLLTRTGLSRQYLVQHCKEYMCKSCYRSNILSPWDERHISVFKSFRRLITDSSTHITFVSMSTEAHFCETWSSPSVLALTWSLCSQETMFKVCWWWNWNLCHSKDFNSKCKKHLSVYVSVVIFTLTLTELK